MADFEACVLDEVAPDADLAPFVDNVLEYCMKVHARRSGIGTAVRTGPIEERPGQAIGVSLVCGRAAATRGGALRV
jgi:hypothetical protein